ncbi:MAG: phenylacetate--CoA ligase family protein [Tenuifilaceae bacterium]
MLSFNKKWRYQLGDILSGKNTWENYIFLSNSQNWERERIEDYQTKKLKELLCHSFDNVPAYRYFMDQAGVNPKTVNPFDILKQLPIIDKKYIFEHYEDFIPKNIKNIKGVKIRKTSGTTGKVLKYYNDAHCRGVVWGSFLRFHDWMGRDFKNKYIVFRGRNFLNERLMSRIKDSVSDILENAKTLDSYSLDDRVINDLITLLEKNPKAILRGYALNVVDIARLLKERGLSYKIQAVSTTAEPLLSFHRKIINDTFNCGIFDQYGCGEVEAVAYECNQHKGLHITEEHVIVELDIDELVLTDLDNYSFPFIKYKNGDKAELSIENCSCGRKSKIINRILGRTSDNVVGLNGLPVHWGYFHHLLIYSNIASARNLVKFQVIQNSINDLVINIISDPLTRDDKDFIKIEIVKKFGNINLIVNNVSAISSSESGKFKAIISYVSNPNQ